MKKQVAISISFVALASVSILSGCGATQVVQAQTPQTRDARYWPFSATSAWNSAIGSDASYAAIENGGGGATWSSLSGGFNPTLWTVSVGVATSSDAVDNLYVNTSSSASNYVWLADGNSECDISNSNASTLLSTSTQSVVFEANPYSTIGTGSNNSETIWPSSYNPISADYSTSFYIPSGLCASPDTDGLLAVIQPDGWVMEAYEGITTANGDVIAGNVAGYYDTQGDGSGWENGRRASMIPAIAGLIRKGEVSAGLIPHALAVTMSPAFLTEAAVWPAYAFDTNSGYTGTQLPMGSLLAIPPTVDLSELGLTASGLIVAQAAQNYGVYVVDRGGAGGVTFQVEYGDTDATFSNNDATIILRQLQLVTNNSQQNPGGGGTPRAPTAPAFSNCDSCTY